MYLVKAAKDFGLYVITSGYNAFAPAHKYSDKYISADYTDQDALLKIAEDEQIDYMCSCANDRGLLSTAYVCEKLGLPGHDSYETSLMIHKKNRFKELAERINLSTPAARSFSDVDEAIAFLKCSDRTMVVKPADGCAGRGISELEPGDDPAGALEAAFKQSLTNSIVIEPFIHGSLHSASVFLINQKAVFCFIDEGVVKETNNHGMGAALSPSGNKAQIEQQLVGEFEKLAAALHLVDGKLHANFIVDQFGKIQILEMHRRCSGDTYSRFIEASTGVKWNEWIVRAEMGLDVSDFPRWAPQKNNIMYYVLVPPTNGVYKRTIIDESVCRRIVYSTVEREENAMITDCRTEFVGILALKFDSYEEMKATSQNMSNLVKIEMEE